MQSINILGLLWSVTVLCSALELTSPDYLTITGGCPKEKCGELLKNATYREYFENFQRRDCPYKLVLDQCGCSRICPQAPYQPCGGPYHMYGLCVKKGLFNGDVDNHYCTTSDFQRHEGISDRNITGTCLRKSCTTCHPCLHTLHALLLVWLLCASIARL